MVSSKLKQILVIALLLIYAHGIEEIITGFYQQDSFISFFSNYYQTVPEAVYWVFHLTTWVMLGIVLLLVFGGKWIFRVLALFGIIFFFELHHPIKALLSGTYYPGMITALLYPVVGIFYWKQLLADWRRMI